MHTVVLETRIQAPIELCFDMARDIGLHVKTSSFTQERAVAGVTSGLIGLGEEVTFEGVHFGVRQRLTARIVQYDRPRLFVDEMQRGAFKSLMHTHEFAGTAEGTLMKDTLVWTSPLGPLGWIADKLVLERHMRRFLEQRNARLKSEIETS